MLTPRKLIKANGWALFQCRGTDGKTPAVPKGASWQDKKHHVKPTEGVLALAASGEKNIAAPIPKNVLVVDIDKKKQAAKLSKACGVPNLLTTTLAIETGNGYHLYFKMPKGLEVKALKNHITAFKKVDLRKHGMYMVVPPSKHYSGTHYAQLDNGINTPQKMPPRFKRFIEECTAEVTAGGKHLTSADLVTLDANEKDTYLTYADFEKCLDMLNPEDFSDMDNEFVPLLLAVHNTMRGQKQARDIFINWARGDNGYNTPKHIAMNRAMWDTAKL